MSKMSKVLAGGALAWAVLVVLASCGGSSGTEAGADSGVRLGDPDGQARGDGQRPGQDSTAPEESGPGEELAGPDASVGPDVPAPPDELSEALDAPCVPACTGKECGGDGCGGQCGSCPEAAPLCVDGKCKVQCNPDCVGKECGDDGCGGNCGLCPPALPECIAFKCETVCTADCVGKECGDDGCGSQCGICPMAAPVCVDNVCTIPCPTDCEGKECGNDGCGGQCGICPAELPFCENGLCVAEPGIDDGCTDEGKQVFIVTESNLLLRFEPEAANIIPIGTLGCPADWGATPFSMSVDRNSFAWVLYNDGTLWKVNTVDASCEATTFQPYQLGFEVFGMGFSTNGPDTVEETLFIAGGSMWEIGTTDATLGSINLETLAVTSIAQLQAGSGSPELTGNRSGELWGFFPHTSPPRVAHIDKEKATLLEQFLLPADLFDGVEAWAFAHWGGDFYIFFKSYFLGSSGIWKVAGGSGELSTAIESTGYKITGAGVSTCAPIGPGEP
jgi:hypothetical protein